METNLDWIPIYLEAGLRSFLNDLLGICVSLLLIALFITLNYKELLISGFDPEYAFSPTAGDALQYLLWGLLTFLRHQFPASDQGDPRLCPIDYTCSFCIPPCQKNEFLSLDCRDPGCRFWFGGAFLSFLGERLPTGPLIVLIASFLFLLIFDFSAS